MNRPEFMQPISYYGALGFFLILVVVIFAIIVSPVMTVMTVIVNIKEFT